MSSEDKLADCLASLSDALRNVKARPSVSALINMKLRDVIRLWLAPHSISFTRDAEVDFPPQDDDEDEPVRGSKLPLPDDVHELANLANQGNELAQEKLARFAANFGIDDEEINDYDGWHVVAAEITKRMNGKKMPVKKRKK